MELLKSPAEDHPEILRLLGLITIRWASAEGQIAKLLGGLLSDQDAAERVYYALGSFRQRQQLVLALLRADVEDGFYKRAAERCLEKLGKLWSTRNDYLHSPFILGEQGRISVRKIRPATPAASGVFPVHPNDLTSHADRVYRMTLKLYALSNHSSLEQIRDAKGKLNWVRYAYRKLPKS